MTEKTARVIRPLVVVKAAGQYAEDEFYCYHLLSCNENLDSMHPCLKQIQSEYRKAGLLPEILKRCSTYRDYENLWLRDPKPPTTILVPKSVNSGSSGFNLSTEDQNEAVNSREFNPGPQFCGPGYDLPCDAATDMTQLLIGHREGFKLGAHRQSTPVVVRSRYANLPNSDELNIAALQLPGIVLGDAFPSTYSKEDLHALVVGAHKFQANVRTVGKRIRFF